MQQEKTFLCTSTDNRHLTCVEAPQKQTPHRQLVKSHPKILARQAAPEKLLVQGRKKCDRTENPAHPAPDFVRHFTTDITLVPVPAFGDPEEGINFHSDDGTFTIRGAMVNQVGRQIHLNVYDDLGRFFTTGRPAVFRFNLPVPTTINQLSAGIAVFSDDERTASGDAAAHAEVYSTGTISQTGNVITGMNTDFDISMVGGTITFNNGQKSVITAFTSPTSLTVDRAANITARAFTLQFSYGQVYLIGPNIAAEEVPENSQLTFDMHYII